MGLKNGWRVAFHLISVIYQTDRTENDVLICVATAVPAHRNQQSDPEPVHESDTGPGAGRNAVGDLADGPVDGLADGPADGPVSPCRVPPVSPCRVSLVSPCRVSPVSPLPRLDAALGPFAS